MAKKSNRRDTERCKYQSTDLRLVVTDRMADYHSHAGDTLERKRIMVVGKDVATVQRVSRAYLAYGADVFPYYGSLNLADVELFDPHLLVLCLPMSDNFLLPTNRPYLVWTDHQAIAALSLTSDFMPQAS